MEKRDLFIEEELSTYSNSMQNVINNLLERNLLDNINELLKTVNAQSNRRFLEKMINEGHLPRGSFDSEYDLIENHYTNAKNNFTKDKKASPLSYGISIITGNVYLYMTKEFESSLNYINRFENIEPIPFDKYMKDSNISDKTKISKESDFISKAGLNVRGYSFEFNVNLFLSQLANLIELPNLMIQLHPSFGQFLELDIAYFNCEPLINNNNLSLLKTNWYIKYHSNKFVIESNKEFDIYENSLILGEVKLRFPRFMKDDIRKEQSLQAIIHNLLYKIWKYVELFKNLKLFDSTKIKNIQLILFYDNTQLINLNSEKIKKMIKSFKNIYFISQIANETPIHFFIVYVLPTITNVTMFEMTKQIRKLNEKDKEIEGKILKISSELNKLKDELKIYRNVDLININEQATIINTSENKNKSMIKNDNKNNEVKNLINFDDFEIAEKVKSNYGIVDLTKINIDKGNVKTEIKDINDIFDAFQ